MSQNRKVLISMYSYIYPGETHSVSVIRDSYLIKLAQYNLVPILISGNTSQNTLEELYSICSGVLFPGGMDIDPDFYGEVRHIKTQKSDKNRDQMELTILQKTLKDNKPFLGICRGAQALAIACGGSLMQHLPDITKEEHDISEGQSYDHLYTNPMHEVIISRDSKAYGIFNNEKITVPSGHHQAIKNPGSLRVSGVSPEGIIEIVEHPSLPFHIGFQGHPEVTTSLDALFQAFSQAIG